MKQTTASFHNQTLYYEFEQNHSSCRKDKRPPLSVHALQFQGEVTYDGLLDATDSIGFPQDNP